MIKINRLSFFRKNKKILKDIDFHTEEGEVISILGPNGSGKSTLLKCIIGILNSEKKKIFIKGISLENYSSRTLAKQIAFLPQIQENFDNLTVYELISIGTNNSWIQSKKNKEKIFKIIKYMKLENKIHDKVQNLSGGERQKVLIATALVRDTPIIIMDEPSTYMDIKNQWELLQIIRDLKENLNKTIICVFHDINHALEVSDKVYLLKEGEIYKSGIPSEVITRENLREVYQVDTHIHMRMCHLGKCKKFSVVPIGSN